MNENLRRALTAPVWQGAFAVLDLVERARTAWAHEPKGALGKTIDKAFCRVRKTIVYNLTDPLIEVERRRAAFLGVAWARVLSSRVAGQVGWLSVDATSGELQPLRPEEAARVCDRFVPVYVCGDLRRQIAHEIYLAARRECNRLVASNAAIEPPKAA